MSFLAPMFLLGGLAIGLPIVFHLIRRPSKEKIPFSSLMFLQPSPPRVTRRSRLENLLLLLLRCLVILLLAAGFARPFIQKPISPDPKSGQGMRTIVLLDTSASMRRAGLWAEARNEAENIVRRSTPADRVALITFDREIRTMWSFDDWSRFTPPERTAMARQRLETLEPGWNSTQLGNALIQASEMLQDSREARTDNRRIVLISDLQKGSHLEGLQGHDWPAGLEVTIVPIKTRRVTNAGLQLVTERDEATEGDVKIRVNNSAESEHEQFRVNWRLANQNVGGELPAYVPPGQSRIFTAPKLNTNQTGEQLVLTGDQEEFDNSVYWVTPRPERVPFLYLGKESEKNPDQSLYYVNRAFQQTRRLDVKIVMLPADISALPREIETARLALISEDAAAAQVKFAHDFVERGNMGLLVLRSKAAGPVLAELLGRATVDVAEAPTSGYAMLSEIDFEHPLFAPFADPRFNDFTKIHFWKHRRVDLTGMQNPRVLARFENGDPALMQLPVGRGTLMVLAAGWYPVDSQLALSSKFVPLLYGLLEQSG
ncbi:MAG TPA: BatA and WFA domain-containing protein, partial [Verrucomicrobiae bacterium]